MLTSSSPSSSNIRGCSCAGGAEQNVGEEEGGDDNGIDDEVNTDPQHDLHTCLNVPALRPAIRKCG